YLVALQTKSAGERDRAETQARTEMTGIETAQRDDSVSPCEQLDRRPWRCRVPGNRVAIDRQWFAERRNGKKSSVVESMQQRCTGNGRESGRRLWRSRKHAFRTRRDDQIPGVSAFVEQARERLLSGGDPAGDPSEIRRFSMRDCHHEFVGGCRDDEHGGP